MFTGQYHHTIDDKNRLAIPAALRDSIDVTSEGKGFILTQGLGGCLFMFTKTPWQEIEAKIKHLPLANENARNFQRLFFSTMQEIPECDPQGRILVSQKLKDFAQIKKNVTIVGVNNRIEIWDEKRWETFIQEQGKSFETIAEGLF